MASHPQSPEEQVARRAHALDLLLRSERGALLRQARHHSRRSQDAEDALSDACVQFLRFYDGPAGEDALHWMLLVVKRAAWAIQRKARTRERHHRAAVGDPLCRLREVAALGESVGPEELAERAEETARLTWAIERLKPDERTALILRGLGCSREEIAALRGWSLTKVRRCLREGRARVREMQEEGAVSGAGAFDTRGRFAAD